MKIFNLKGTTTRIFTLFTILYSKGNKT